MIKDLLAHIAQGSSQLSPAGAVAQDPPMNSGVFGAMLASISKDEKAGGDMMYALDQNAGSNDLNTENEPADDEGEEITLAKVEELEQEVSSNFSGAEPDPDKMNAGEQNKHSDVSGQDESLAKKSGTSINVKEGNEVGAAIIPSKDMIPTDNIIGDARPEINAKKQTGITESNVLKPEPNPVLTEKKPVPNNASGDKKTVDLAPVLSKKPETEPEQTVPFATKIEIRGQAQTNSDPGILKSEKRETQLTPSGDRNEGSINQIPQAEGLQSRVSASQNEGNQNVDYGSKPGREISLNESTLVRKVKEIQEQQIEPVQTALEKQRSETANNEAVRAGNPAHVYKIARFADIQPGFMDSKTAHASAPGNPDIKMVLIPDQNKPAVQQNISTGGAEFGNAKNPELIQVIQSHKTEVLKPKEMNNQQFALSMSEQAETRLKLLVDSVRPEILPSRELPVGFITSQSPEEGFQFFNPELTLTSDQELMLKEFMTESVQGKDQKSSEQNLLGFMRLGEFPVLNSIARRALVSNFAKVLQQEVSTPVNQQQEQWQKHSFKLDDGNNIDMTTRNIDGVLHIKLAASNPELNRLLQNMEQEIKDHLKEELDLDLNLQFENKDEAFGNMMEGGSGESGSGMKNSAPDRNAEENGRDSNNGLQPSIRNFGYNQKEWIA